jgi:hypothetical protein
MVALMKYGTGMPFNRLEGLQADLGIPLATSRSRVNTGSNNYAWS